MQLIEVFRTIRWIEDQFTETAKQILFQKGGLVEELRNDPNKELTSIINAIRSLDRVTPVLSAHPTASEVLEAFSLQVLLDENLPTQLMQALMSIKNDSRMNEINNVINPIIENWYIMTVCVEPIVGLPYPRVY